MGAIIQCACWYALEICDKCNESPHGAVSIEWYGFAIIKSKQAHSMIIISNIHNNSNK